MTNPLPPGFIAHDGSGCPVPLNSRPGVMFRDGFISKPQVIKAHSWIRIRQNFWQFYDLESSDDIIAYCPDPEFGE
jgi:hypothetical protein